MHPAPYILTHKYTKCVCVCVCVCTCTHVSVCVWHILHATTDIPHEGSSCDCSGDDVLIEQNIGGHERDKLWQVSDHNIRTA